MQFRILGPLEVVDDGRPLEIGPGRQRALLLLLLVHKDEVVSSDRLVDMLWGERPPATAPKALQGYVSQLRRVLPDGAIETRGSGYVLRAGTSDREEFEGLLAAAGEQSPREAERTLRTALGLWRGRALADVEYEPWAQAEIARLEELRQVAIEERIAAGLELGGHVRAVPELEAQIAQHPLRERLHALLMLALYRAGRQADALASYATARKKLTEELGIEPGPELRDLQRRILEQDASLAAQAPPLTEAVRHAPWLVITGGLVVVAAAVTAGILLTRGSGRAPAAIPNSLGVIDPGSDRLLRVVPVGATPTSVAVGAGAVWVLNSDEETVSRVDPANRTVVRTTGSGPAPITLATGAGSLWISGAGHMLRRIDPGTGLTAVAPIPRSRDAPATDTASWVASDGRNVWASNADSVSRVRPGPTLISVPSATDCCGPLAIGADSVWTTDATGLVRLDGRSGAVRGHVPLPFLANGSGSGPRLAVGFGSVWVVDTNENTVWRVGIEAGRVLGTITVGSHPSGVAVGAGAVWVACSDGTVARIDPTGAGGLGRVVRTIRVGATPNGIAVGDGAVWVTVD